MHLFKWLSLNKNNKQPNNEDVVFGALPSLLTIDQVCEIFKVHPNTIRNWDKIGKLPAVRIGIRKDRRYEKDTVIKFYNQMNLDNKRPKTKNGKKEKEPIKDQIPKPEVSKYVIQPGWSIAKIKLLLISKKFSVFVYSVGLVAFAFLTIQVTFFTYVYVGQAEPKPPQAIFARIQGSEANGWENTEQGLQIDALSSSGLENFNAKNSAVFRNGPVIKNSELAIDTISDVYEVSKFQVLENLSNNALLNDVVIRFSLAVDSYKGNEDIITFQYSLDNGKNWEVLDSFVLLDDVSNITHDGYWDYSIGDQVQSGKDLTNLKVRVIYNAVPSENESVAYLDGVDLEVDAQAPNTISDQIFASFDVADEYLPEQDPVISVGVEEKTFLGIGGDKRKVNSMTITDPEGKNLDADLIIIEESENKEEKLANYKIKKEDLKRPGLYTVKSEIEQSGIKQEVIDEFRWGTLVINTDQEKYATGDNVQFSIGIFDDYGNPVCDANLFLEVTDEKGEKKGLSTKVDTITQNSKCAIQGTVTNESDYNAGYQVDKKGNYTAKLDATYNGITQTISKSFTVDNKQSFSIKRHGPTRITPGEIHTMTLEISSDHDFIGEIRDQVPSNFMYIGPTDDCYGKHLLDDQGNFAHAMEIICNVNLKANTTNQISYQFLSLHPTHQYYEYGPTILANFNTEYSSEHKWSALLRDGKVEQNIFNILSEGGSPGVIIKAKDENTKLTANIVNEKKAGDYITGNVSNSELLQLLNDEEVFSVSFDQPTGLLIEDVIPLINAELSDRPNGETGAGQKICIVDTGVDYNHPAIGNYTAGYDFVNNDDDPMDDHGHGTSVAGAISAIAPEAELYVAKVLDQNGNGYESNLVAGLQWCRDQAVDIINVSVGAGVYNGYCDTNPVAEVINEAAVDNNIYTVAAVGNESAEGVAAPSCAFYATRVGSTNDNDEISDFTNMNVMVDILAPGEGINLPTLNGNYNEVSGTSFSAPIVSAAAALVLENENLLPLDLKYRLRSTGQPIDYNSNTQGTFQIGRVDVKNALTNTYLLEPFEYWPDDVLTFEDGYGPLVGENSLPPQCATGSITDGNSCCTSLDLCSAGRAPLGSYSTSCDASANACANCCDNRSASLGLLCTSNYYYLNTFNYDVSRSGSYDCCGDDGIEGLPYQAAENTPVNYCSDGRDNDCDGTYDTGDSECQTSVNMTGKAYTDKTEGTPITTSTSVCVAVNAGTPICDATDASGVFEITGVTTSSGDQLTFFIDGGSILGNTVTVSDGSEIVTGDNLRIYQNTVMVRHETGTSIEIVEMDAYDNDQNATDMLYDAEDLATDTLVVESNIELLVYAGFTLDPNGTVTTQGTGSLYVDDNATAYLDTATSTIASQFTVDTGATLSVSSATTNINGTGTNTVTGTLSGTGSMTILGTLTGAGTVTMTSGSTITQSVSGAGRTIGSNSGSNNWTFNNLTLTNTSGTNTITSTSGGTGQIIVNGTLTTSNSGTALVFDNETNDRILDIGQLSILSGSTISASSTASFTISGNVGSAGTFTANSGTVTFDGTSGTKYINMSSAYYNVIFNGSGSTWQNDTTNMTVTNNMTITAGTFEPYNSVTVNGGANGGVTINGGTLNVGANIFTVGNSTDEDLTVSSGSVSFSGGTINVMDDLIITTGTVTINTAVVISGILNQDGGTLTIDTGANVDVGGVTTSGVLVDVDGGIVNLNNGSIDSNAEMGFTGNTTVNLNGGSHHAGTSGGNGTITWNNTTGNFTLNMISGTNPDANGCNITSSNFNVYANGNMATTTVTGGTICMGTAHTARNFYDVETNSHSFYNLKILEDAQTNDATNQPIRLNGDFTINASKTFNAKDNTFEIKGDYTNSGIFTGGTSTVTLNSSTAGQQLFGNMTGTSSFYNLTLANSGGGINFAAAASATATFTATTASQVILFLTGATYTFQNINVNGQSTGTRANLVGQGTWYLNVAGSRTVLNTTASYSNACGQAPNIDATNTSNLDGGDTSCWNWPVAATTVSGTSNTTGTVKIAVNGSLQVDSNVISGSAWSVSADTILTGGETITVFIDGATTDESTAVTEYDGTGNITGMVLNSNVLSIGSDDTGVTLTVTQLGQYDNDQDEDIMHTANSGTLNVDDDSAYTDDTISILGADTLTIGDSQTMNAHNVLITGLLVSVGDSNYNVGGDWTNNGDFTDSTSTVILNGTAPQTLSGQMTGASDRFYNLYPMNGSGTDPDTDPGIIFSASAETANYFDNNTAEAMIRFNAGSTYTFQNLFFAYGLDGQHIYLRSSSGGSQWNLNVQGTSTVTHTNVKDSNATTSASAINATGVYNIGTNQNNLNWNFGRINISGKVYQENESSNVGSGVTVQVQVNGVNKDSDDTDINGDYSINNIGVFADDIVTVFIDNNGTYEGTAVVKSNQLDITGLDVIQNAVIVRDEVGNGISNADMEPGDRDAGDDDIKFEITTNDISLDSGFELHIWTGDTYDPGGVITTNATGGDLHVDDNATAYIDTATSTIGQDVIVDGGAKLYINANMNINGGDIITTGTSALVDTTTGTPTVTISGTGNIGGGTTPSITFYKLVTAGSGTTSVTSPISTDNNIEIGSGNTLAGTGNMSIFGGSLTGAGILNMSGGVVTLYNTGSIHGTGNSNKWTFYDLNLERFGGCTGTDYTTSALGTGDIEITHTLDSDYCSCGETCDGVRYLSAAPEGDKKWILSGDGTPITNLYLANRETENSTFEYTGTGSVNLFRVGFHNLSINPTSGGTYNASSGLYIYGDLYIKSGLTGFNVGSSEVRLLGSNNTIDAGGINFYDLTVDIEGSANYTVINTDFSVSRALLINYSDSLTINAGRKVTHTGSIMYFVGTLDGLGQMVFTNTSPGPGGGGTLNSNVRYDASGGNIESTTIDARTYGGDVEIFNNSATPRTVTLPSGTFNITNVGTDPNLHINANNSANVTLDAAQNNPTLNIDGDIQFNGVGNGTESLEGTASVNVHGGDVIGNGVINMTGGAFKVTDGGNFGSDQNWTFNTLRYDYTGTSACENNSTVGTGSGSVTINNELQFDTCFSGDTKFYTLQAGAKTWVIKGSSNTPFVGTHWIEGDTSTFIIRSQGGAVTLPVKHDAGANYFYNLVLQPDGDPSVAPEYIFPDTTGGSFNVTNNLTLGDNFDNDVDTFTVNGTTNNPDIIIGNDLLCNNGLGTSTIDTGTGTWSVSGNMNLTNCDVWNTTVGNTFEVDGSGKSVTSAGKALYNFDVTGGSVSNADVMNIAGNFSVAAAAEFIHGTNANVLVTGDNFILSDTSTYTKAEGTGRLILDGLSDNQWFDDQSTGVKQDMGTVQIGQSPGTTKLKSDFSATNLVIATGDKFETHGWEVDLSGYLDCQGTCTFNLTDNVPNNEGDGTIVTIGGNYTMSASGTFTPSTDSLVEADGTVDQTVTTGNLAFNDFKVNNGGTTNDNVVISGNLDVNGDLTVDDGEMEISSNNPNVNTAGDVTFASGTTVTKGTGTWTFDGTTAKTYTDSTSTPQNIGTVVFNKTSGTPAQDKITLASSMTADTIDIQTGDTLDLASGPYTLTLANAGATATVLTVTGTLTPGDSLVKYSATNSGGNVNVTTTTYDSLQLSGAEIYDLSGNLTSTNGLTGDITIDSGGTLSTSGSNYNIDLAGNWTNNGEFTDGTSTVTLDGTATQTLSGQMTGATDRFYNLTVINAGASNPDVDFAAAADVDNNFTVDTADSQLEFNAGSTYIFNNVSFNGSTGQLVTLRSSTPGTQWNLTSVGNQTVTYTDVQDSYACGGDTIDASGGTNVNSQNNDCWIFVGMSVSISPNSIDLGTLLNTLVSQDGVTLTVSTDAANGYQASVYYDNTLSNGLGDTIDDTSGGTIVAGTEEFGASSSRSGYNIGQWNPTSCADTANTSNATALTTSPQTFTGATSGVSSHETTLCILGSIMGLTEAGSYSDTITIVVTGLF